MFGSQGSALWPSTASTWLHSNLPVYGSDRTLASSSQYESRMRTWRVETGMPFSGELAFSLILITWMLSVLVYFFKACGLPKTHGDSHRV